jgi:hypothetical protein
MAENFPTSTNDSECGRRVAAVAGKADTTCESENDSMEPSRLRMTFQARMFGDWSWEGLSCAAVLRRLESIDEMRAPLLAEGGREVPQIGTQADE